MPVPTAITDLSTTAANNFPAGSDGPSSLDDVQRAQGAFIAQIRDAVGMATGTLVPATARTSFGAAASGANTDITSMTGLSNGGIPLAKVSGAAGSGANDDITSLTGLTTPVSRVRHLQPIGASVASNALTISASALALDFRSATLGSGTVTSVTGTPANLVVSSGSTLGAISAQQSRIVVLALNNAGTIELAAVNIAGGNDLTETGVISTTAEGGAGAADSASVVYSTTARTNVAYRVLGYIESTQATAGTWVTAPSTIQGCGGQALAAMSSSGFGQSWQGLTGSRSIGVTYYNTTSKEIKVHAGCSGAIAPCYLTVGVPGTAGSTASYGQPGTSTIIPLFATVPPGHFYYLTYPGGSITQWSEER